MSRIFIDTSVFVAENFLEGNRIKELLRLFREGHYENVIPLITVNEIKGQYYKKVRIAIEAHSATLNKKELDVLRNFRESKPFLTKFPKPKTVGEAFNLELDKQLKSACSEILAYPTIDTTDLFNNYFSGKAPFNTSDKKNEFPDAIAIETIVQWCEENKCKCIVLSNDNDFKNVTHKNLIIEPDYKLFLDNILKKILAERKEIVELLYIDNKSDIEKDIKSWIHNKFDDFTIYYDVANGMDIHDVDIKSIKVSAIDYQVTNIEPHNITIEINVKARVKINIDIDDESAVYYDSDDKSYHYFDTTTKELDQKFEFPVLVQFEVTSKTDYHTGFDITEYNHGDSLELEYDHYDY